MKVFIKIRKFWREFPNRLIFHRKLDAEIYKFTSLSEIHQKNNIFNQNFKVLERILKK